MFRWRVVLVVAAMLVIVVGGTGSRTGTDVARAAGSFVAGSVCLPGRSAADLDTLFYSEPGGVIGADYQRAFTMSDGRVLWTFQDAAVRLGPDDITIVHNIAMIQDGNCFNVLYGGSRSDPQPMFFAGRTVQYHRWFWPLAATAGADGNIVVFAAEMEERGAEYLTHTVPVGTWVAVFDPVTATVVAETRPADGSADLYGWSITSDADWTYLYAQCYRQFGFDEYAFVKAFDRSCATEVTVARVPKGEIFRPPAYWNGVTWQPDPAAAKPIIDERGRRINADQFQWTGAGFVSVNKEGDWWGDTIHLSRSTSPAGPFVVYDSIAAPLKCDPSACNSFFATWIPAAAADRPLDRFVISIAHNRWDGVVTALYRPSFLAVDAPSHLPPDGTIARAIDGDASAIVLNVGVVGPAEPGFLSVYPCDQGLPDASNVNHVGEPVVSNLVFARPDSSGRVCVYSRASTDLIVDQSGSFAPGAGFEPVSRPVRLADTRIGLGIARGRVPAGGVLEVPVPDGADRASVLNVIAVAPSKPGFLSVYPCGSSVPETSNVNYVSEPVVSNLVIAEAGATGTVCISSLSETDVVVDLAGSFAAAADGYDPLDVPTRLLDTRLGDRPAAGDIVTIEMPPDVAGAAAGVVLNVAVVEPDAPGFATVYPCGVARPNTSNINHVHIPVVSNIVIARPADDGTVCVFTSSASDLVVDLFGVLPAGSGYQALDVPRRLVDTRNGIGIEGQFGVR